MLSGLDFSSLIRSAKNVFSISVMFYKALGDLFLKLWDLLKLLIGFVNGIVN